MMFKPLVKLARWTAGISALILAQSCTDASEPDTPVATDTVVDSTVVPASSGISAPAAGATLTSLILTPGTTSIHVNSSQAYTVAARWSDGSTSVPSLTYTATGGTITDGIYHAGATKGSYRIIARQTGGVLADTASITVTQLVKINLSPGSVTLAVGGTQQFTATGTRSDGSVDPQPVTWSATGGTIGTSGLYTAGSTSGTYRVIAVNKGGTLADTSTVVIQGTTQSKPAAGAVFYSDWSSAQGRTDNSLRDLTKSTPWQSQNDSHSLLTVVSASGLGFPTGMANVLRVMHPQSGPVSGHVISPSVWDNPQVGETRYYRVYLSSRIADDEGNMGSGYTTHHPMEDTQLTGSSAENWEFEYSPWGGGTNNGRFAWVFGMLHGPAWPRTRWHPGSGFANLQKFVAYRIEWSFTKTATNTYTLNDLRIYNSSNTLLYDKNTMYAADNSTRLAGNNTGLTLSDSQIRYFWLGTNGGSAMQMGKRDEYDYWGGVCVRSDTWCGAYTAGEH